MRVCPDLSVARFIKKANLNDMFYLTAKAWDQVISKTMDGGKDRWIDRQMDGLGSILSITFMLLETATTHTLDTIYSQRDSCHFKLDMLFTVLTSNMCTILLVLSVLA